MTTSIESNGYYSLFVNSNYYETFYLRQLSDGFHVSVYSVTSCSSA